jgi:hypothetical protein
MGSSIRYEIASALHDTIYFSGYSPEIEKVKLGDKDAWRVSAMDRIIVDVVSPSNIIVYTGGKSKSFDSEYKAKTFILGEILEQ